MNINLNEAYDLLDDFFIDQDSTTNTGEVQSSGVDANILVNNKDVSKQIKLMRTAVDKIYKGYLAAYDKSSYKEQFDIYPMRDFDEHMASLGARRSINGLDFEPVGEKIDWVQKIKDEITARLSAREKQDLENKKDEKTETTQTTTKPKTDYNAGINAMLESVPSNGTLGGLDVTQTTMLKKLDPASRKIIIDGLISSTDNSENNKFIKTRLALTDEQLNNLRKQIKDIVITADLTNEKETKAEVKAKNEKASETTPGDSTQSTREIEANKAKYESIQKKIKDLEGDLSKLPDIMVGEKTNINSQLDSLKSELSDVEKQNKILSDKLKTATKLRSKNIKGAKVNAEDLDKLTSAIQTDYERKISEYDGFTTAGPFCLEKRKYFRDVYRPSIDHFDTEFRESIPTPIAKINDIGNDIISIMHKKGTMPTIINTAEDFAKLPVETQKNFRDANKKLKSDLETFTKNAGIPPTASKTFEDFCVVTKYIMSVIVKKADAWIGCHDSGTPIFNDPYFTKVYNLLIETYSKLFTNNEDDIKILTESYWDPDMEIIRNKFFLYISEIVKHSLSKLNTEFGNVLSQSYLTDWDKYKNAKNIGETH